MKQIIPYWAISAHPFIVDCFAGRLEARDARDSGTTREGRWFIIISMFLSWCKYVNDKYLWNTFGSFHPINMFWLCNFLKFVNYKFRSCVIFYMHVLDIIIIILIQIFSKYNSFSRHVSSGFSLRDIQRIPDWRGVLHLVSEQVFFLLL